MLAIYKNLNKQIILTSTLKNEEYEKSKYNRIDKINSIDYSEHQDCKILSNKVTSDFVNLISGFNGLML